MNSVSSITSKCRELIEASSIAVEDKRVIEKKLDEIEGLLREDPFAAQRCSFMALPRFQHMLDHAQLLHESPSPNAFSDILAGSDGIIEFLVGKKPAPVSTPPTAAE
jgi:hypothetical protein